MSLLESLVRRPWAALATAAAVVALFGPGLLRLETDNSPEVFIETDGPAAERYDRFRRAFGGDRLVRVVVTGAEPWRPDTVVWLTGLVEELAALPGVVEVREPVGHLARWQGDPYVDAAIRDLETSIASDPLARALGWVGAGDDLLTLSLLLEATGGVGTRRLLAAIEERLTSSPPGVTVELVGQPTLDRALDASSREIERRFFPLLVLLSAVLLWLAFRTLAGVAMPLLFVGLTEVALLGSMGYAGAQLNMVLAILPPLVFVIALATAVHLLSAHRRALARGLSPADATLTVFRDRGWAVLWTGITTLVGFASLGFSGVGPVRSLGLWAGIGIAILIALAFTVWPGLQRFDRGRRRASRPAGSALAHAGLRWAIWSVRWRRPVFAVAAGWLLFAGAGLSKLRIETDALRFFKSQHPVRRSIERLEGAGIGSAAVEILMPAASEGGETGSRAAWLEAVRQVERQLDQDPAVLSTLSAVTLVEDLRHHLPAPMASAEDPAILAALELDDEGSTALARFRSNSAARVTAFTRFTGAEGIDALEARLGAHRPAVEVTGLYPLLVRSQRGLLRTLLLSLGMTFAVVALVFRRLLAGSRLTLLALVPNLWPVVGSLGLLGWLGQPLDIASIMVASIVLGLAVDDTIHTLGHYRRAAPVLGKNEAAAEALERTAPAYILTGLILTLGFGVCALSSFAPIARFGVAAAVAIALAVVGDLFLLPALLSAAPQSTIERLRRDEAPRPTPT